MLAAIAEPHATEAASCSPSPARSASAARCCRCPTSAASSISPAASPSSASRWSRPAAPRASSRAPGSRCAASRTSPASPRSWTAASRRCTPSSTPGLLARRDDPEHLRQAAENEIEFVDLVCVNLYPFERTAGAVRRERAGGHRGHRHRRPGDDPRDARRTTRSPRSSSRPRATTPSSRSCAIGEGMLSLPTREWLAAEAFSYTARYDTAISRWFAEKTEEFPQLPPARVREGHRAAVRREPAPARRLLRPGRRPRARALAGAPAPRQADLLQQHPRPRLGADALRDLGDEPACVIVKHNNPCGAAVADGPRRRVPRGVRVRPMSAFGGVIAVNRPVDVATAQALTEQFVEVLFAPGYEDGALEALRSSRTCACSRTRSAASRCSARRTSAR